MIDSTLNDIIKKFENYPSIMKIEENINKNFKWSFSSITRDEVEKEINLIDISKSQPNNGIYIKAIKYS